ncbi:MAG TPA: hypothetical protein VE131_15715 [Terriglobales bacterium]|nr:hypothetical protein [Terriglobales bacterium]
MATSIWLKAAALWLVILLLAILNGTLREKTLIPVLGSSAGLAASGAILSMCVFIVALVAAPWYGPLTSRQWYWVGLFWLLLTVVFEFSFGLLVQHKSLAALLDAYTFRGGNIWPIVLVTTLISPWLAAKIRGLI